MTNLSPRQSDTLEAIRAYRHRTGMSPRLQDLQDALGISKISIYEHLCALESKKAIRRSRKARSIEIIGDKRKAVWPRFPILGTISKEGIQ
jgi:SOS-response transcriptional repressor LexA